MTQVADTERLLSDIGYLGNLQIDLTERRARGNGLIAPLLAICPERFADGVGLNLCDDRILPEDLEMMKRHRRDTVATPGLYQSMFNVKNPFGEKPVAVQSIMTVRADRFGLATEATGILIRNPVQTLRSDNDQIGTVDLLRIIRTAYIAAKRLGLNDTASVLPTAYNLAAIDGLGMPDGQFEE